MNNISTIAHKSWFYWERDLKHKEKSGLHILLYTQQNVVCYLSEKSPWAESKPPHTIMSFHPTLDWIVSVYFDLFYKRKLDWGAAPRGSGGVTSPPANDSQEQAWVKGQSLLLKCVNEIKLFSDLRKLVFLFPAGLIVPDLSCSLSIGWLICCYNPMPATLIGYRHPGSDGLCRPTTASTATLPNPEEHVNFNKVIKAGVWTGIKSPGAVHKVTLFTNCWQRSLNSSANTRTIAWTLLLVFCKTDKKCCDKQRIDIQRVVRKKFLPLSHSNVPAVETWCQLRRRAPCSRSRSPPPPRSQRSGRWAPRRSLSPPRSPTDSRRLRGSYCPRTGHGRTGPWFWPQPLGDLHTLWAEKLI